MNPKRREIYENLSEEIGNTPLVEYAGKVPNNNRVLIKRECDNPFGSHYDRVYLELFRHFEETGRINPGDKVLETTSGSAGVSFAGIGKELGYECYVALPANGEKAREQAIKEQLVDDEHLIITPGDQYVSGFPNFVKEYLKDNRDTTFLNHSMGRRNKGGTFDNNEESLRALEKIAKEVLESANVDYFVPAVGNGSSVLGPGRVLRDTKIVAFETFQSAVTYELKYPGKYEKEFGILPGSLSRHKLPGTSYKGIDFPHIRNSLNIIDDVVLVSDQNMDSEYKSVTDREDTKTLPHWDNPSIMNDDLGRTSKAGIAVALNLAERIRNQKILIIGYDKAERYDG